MNPSRLPLRSLTAAVAALSLSGLIAGCASTGEVAAPAQRLQPQALGLKTDAAVAFPAGDWWTRFGDPGLDAIETRALAGNPGLQEAAARVRQAEAAVGGARAADLPHLGLGVSSTRERFSENDIYPPPFGGMTVDESQLALQGSWELDLFGRNRAAVAAAIGQARAAAAQQAAARVLLTTQVASAWVGLARLEARHDVLNRLLDQRNRIATLVGERVAAGLDTTVQQRQAQLQVPQIRLLLEQNAAAQVQARDALAALLGAGPDATADLHPQLRSLPTPALPTALPAELLGRRADVVAARWRVESALAGVRQARAAFYPNISLTAFAGFQSVDYSTLMNIGSRIWGVGPAINLPIFEGGALRAKLRASSADADAAIDAYNATLVGAVRDVADAVAARSSLQRQIDQQSTALTMARDARDLVRRRVDAGLGNDLGVLDADGAVLQLEQGAVDLKAQALLDDIALIGALGGGYAEPHDTGGA